MTTVRNLSRVLGGGCLLQGGVWWGGSCSWGVVWSGGCLLQGLEGSCPGGCLRGCLVLGGVWSQGGADSGGLVSQHALRQTPRVDRQTGVKHNLSKFVEHGNEFYT